jgi:hypothetical protein
MAAERVSEAARKHNVDDTRYATAPAVRFPPLAYSRLPGWHSLQHRLAPWRLGSTVAFQ